MNQNKLFFCLLITVILSANSSTTSYGQRVGAITKGRITNHFLISNGPKGPIQGGESAVTDMILLNNCWVYGSTKASWGAQNCHIFRTDGEKTEHLINLSLELPGQTSITDLAIGKGNIIKGKVRPNIESRKPNTRFGRHVGKKHAFALNTFYAKIIKYIICMSLESQ